MNSLSVLPDKIAEWISQYWQNFLVFNISFTHKFICLYFIITTYEL